ncbi:PilW family protein [Ralstonia pseudosolanacearum]|uniref:PilW family protein n=1 Tax=Ralstonia pseudosolanacearum TaxID=1310165 RepID=UPI0007D82554|nr:PilW family protein [Ralstonia pseudosolanacearum]MDC6294525.1 PilW family protein [Ralstonia pseudosolanacearum]MDD7789988.1 PilW family protein [Ralstonia pseudosolanacearum]MDN3369544.1 PilW family protein [Ralstonia pseudosolanacearum]OAK90878.1 type 4 fimbrial biogenesis PilW transmembrane [Ralstonia pseudosolanacearum]QOK85877.1 PilW family protein [Ralstonia pseudosolanacearum]
MRRERKMLRRQRGMSLVELMIGMALGLLLLTALGSLYFSTTQSRAQLANSASQIENGRYVLDLISQELGLAGFMGASSVRSTAALSAPDVCTVATNALGFSSSPATVPVAVYGYAAGANAPCLPNLSASSEILVVRRVSTTAVTTAAAGEAYMQASFCTSDTVPFVFSSTATDFTMRTKACSSTVPAELRQASVRVFYIATCDRCSNGGDGIPTLMMAELSGGQYLFKPIAQGVQDIHFAYGVDMDNNGSADCYVSDPGADNSAACTAVSGYSWATSLTNWGNVTAVRVNVLARTLNIAPGWSDTRTYDLGRGTVSGPFNDGYKRHVYAEVARLANVAGPRE